MSREIVDCLAAPQQPRAAAADASESQAPAIMPASEAVACTPASSAPVSDTASVLGTAATAAQTGPADHIEGAHGDESQAQKRSAVMVEPVAAKPVTWFVPACS